MANARIARLWPPITLLTGGIALLQYAEWAVAQPSGLEPSASLFVLWTAMLTIAAISPIPLPRAQLSVSLTPALEFAAILLFGPVGACWISIASRLICNSVERWNPLPSRLFRLAQAMVAVCASGIVYVSLGGRVGGEILGGSSQILPVLAAAATYLGAKCGLTGLYDAMTSPGATSAPRWLRLSMLASSQLLLLPFSLLLALTQVRIGPVGVALFLVPLLLARYSFRLWHDARRAHLETVRTLMSAIDGADPFTWGLSYRIAKMSVRVGRQLGLSDAELAELEYAAQLHDIGRTAITREILGKPSRLTEKEQAALRQHPRVGYEILSKLRFFTDAAEIVYAHHEQPDGKGYPRGLSGDDIPMGSRIIMAVAAFDAMTSDRPYRRGLAPEAALQELLNHAGTQFFPDVVEALIQLYSQGKLFEEFEPAALASYAEGQCNSRAIAEHLRRTGGVPHVPDKLLVEDGEAARGRPALELVVLEEEDSSLRRQQVVPLDPHGRQRLVLAGRSDAGCVRSNNEDAFEIATAEEPTPGCLLVLADGMGGAAAGEVASRLAVDTVCESYQDERAWRGGHEALREAIVRANRRVHDKSSAERQFQGMGTTCTVASILGRNVIVGHVGDSRAYIVRSDSIDRLTSDHTLASELAEIAETNPALTAGASHVLLRCLGNEPDVHVDVTTRVKPLESGDAVLLCSDGLTGMLADEEIAEIVRQESPEEACRTMVELARARGGPDNITVVVGRLEAA